MTLFRGVELPEAYTGGIVTIGNFDGVHRGHRQMLGELKRLATAAGAPAVVMTFDPHPLQLLRPDEAPPRLTSIERKAELLGELGIDAVFAYETDHALLGLTPEEFFSQIVLGRLRARGLVEGPNFCFGKDRAGDVDTLRQLCNSAGLTCEIIEPVELGGGMISSSRIRAQIAAGDVVAAAENLGHRHRVTGVVAHGAGRGATVGFPTANLEQLDAMLPADGVYAAEAIHGADRYTAAVNIGANPTFGEAQRKVEVHLLDFTGDLYGTTLSLEFLTRIRQVVEFRDRGALREQIETDLKAVRAVANAEISR